MLGERVISMEIYQKNPSVDTLVLEFKKKFLSFFLSPTPFQNGLIQVKCMHLHCFSVKLSSAKELSLLLEKQNLCLFLMYQLNTTHTRCSYHHVRLLNHSSLIYAKSASTCCTLHQKFTNTHFHGVIGNKA